MRMVPPQPIQAVRCSLSLNSRMTQTRLEVSISLADGENMKVYYNRDLVSKIDEDSRDEWYAFLKELKDFAVEHQLRF
jgi:nicotinamide mononucleotide adenylyltransferase